MYHFKIGDVVVVEGYPTMTPMTIVGMDEGSRLEWIGDYRCQWYSGSYLDEATYPAHRLVKIRE